MLSSLIGGINLGLKQSIIDGICGPTHLLPIFNPLQIQEWPHLLSLQSGDFSIIKPINKMKIDTRDKSILNLMKSL